ncbi:tRNA-methyltransferase subunit [Hyphodiscus hymeniophilus]|uniref:tRNA (adenine(58)-N(1))-methyltransferase catalytic subunit TRM61 n=1 Tax=Hyphodiscus hymeniophilus TaxID=353542 RepID=A0A9P7AUB2_9HELO|nr:tRNA-methyltransferase subunit [Hyphodiscus hymeniophilus]
MAPKSSPFFHPGAIATADSLAIIHLKRDLQIPAVLKDHDEDDEGYSEGKVINTRFGSFPHNTMIGLPWGTQVRASKVDTGSRGRRGEAEEKKRKREESVSTEQPNKAPKLDVVEEQDADASTPATVKEEKEAVAAASGFIHLLPPTPENWTSSLPHRTQVVYTPDYSYILHRIRARPGTSLIEAGAGSGSFTHASARAIYNGYTEDFEPPQKKLKTGKVWSFEFHEQRHEKLQKEIQDHGLEGVVQITHRDVCKNGFLVDGKSPLAESVFLDLPAPWLALPHLSRSQPTRFTAEYNDGIPNSKELDEEPFVSPLNPAAPVHICWVDISMVEIAAKRFEIRRDRIGIDNGAQRGLQTTPASVDEALQRLIEVEGTFKNFHENGEKVEGKKNKGSNPNSKEKILESLVEKKVYKEGKLVHRTEPEVKTHTSYLVFAILPQEWTEEDERRAMAQWPVTERVPSSDKTGEADAPLSRRQLKKAARQARKDEAAASKFGGAAQTAEEKQQVGEAEVAGRAEEDQLDTAEEPPTS